MPPTTEREAALKHQAFPRILTLVFIALAPSACRHDQRPAGAKSAAAAPAEPPPGTQLVSGRSIDPDASRPAQDVGSFPINIALAPGGKYAVTTGQGFRQHLWALRTDDGRGVSRLNFPNPTMQKANGLYYGLAFAPDGTLYAAQGAADRIVVAKIDGDGKLTQERRFDTHKGDFPSGLALDGRGLLYVVNNDPDTPHLDKPTPASVAIFEPGAGKEIGRFLFESDLPGSNFPLALAALKDGSKLYVASQRDAAVYVLDTSRPEAVKQVAKVETGSHPVALCLDEPRKRLFVANASSDTVSVVDTTSDRVTATVLLRPTVVKDFAGATPTGLALSPDGKMLYATLGDMNAVAVIDVKDGEAELEGFLPAGWYPTAVVVSPDGKRLLVTNAKGSTAHYVNPPEKQPDKTRHQSPLNLIEGTVSVLTVPRGKELDKQTERVLELNRLTPRYARFLHDNPLKGIGLQAGKIKHVIYMVKENRTYDQVLGDLPQGNGDPQRCLFPRRVTPNLHALAERFVLMDNFYDCGDVSGDGWTWSTQAQANEYVTRNVPYSYSGRGRTFDYEGVVNKYPTGGFPANGPDGKPLSDHPAYREGAKAIPDVAAAPGGHIWDLALKGGLTLRNYGFFMSNGVKEGNVTVIPDNYPADKALQPGGRDLEGVTNVDFRKFDLDYADSDATWKLFEETRDNRFPYGRRTFGKYDARSRFEEWNREFRMMLAKDPAGGAVPNLMLVRFGNDHTVGTNPGKHTPRAMVADNDYAVGQLVEAVSHSPIWESCAIFVIEDDAQNGPDHVDTHRSTCYVISPWIKRGSVDHSFQNTVSVLKTIELLLGLPPMCQYDACAAPILDWDDKPSNAEPYKAVMPDRALFAERNGLGNENKPASPEISEAEKRMMEESAAMNFEVADKAPAERLTEIIWASVKGADSKQPPTPRGAKALRGLAEEDGDDD
jgi:YVTN family beta-propeller protein